MVLGVFKVSGQSKRWGLEECISYAFEHTITIKQAALDLKEAVIGTSDAIGALLPTVEAEGEISDSYGLNFDPTTNLVVTNKLRSGTGRLTGTITLFDGLRNYNAIARARMNVVANTYRIDDLKDDIRLNVTNAFLQVVSNKESLVALKAQYTSIEQELKRTKELVLSGVVAAGDLLDVEAQAADQRWQLTESEGLVLISTLNLAQLIGITDATNFEVSEEIAADFSSDRILGNSPKDIFYRAKTIRNDVNVARVGIKLAGKDLAIAKGASYPSLTVSAQYETRYSSLDTKPESNDPTDFFDQLYLNDGIDIRAELEVPIFNGFSVQNGIKRAKIAMAIADIEYKRTLFELEIAVYRAYVDVTNFYNAYKAASKTLRARRLAHEYSTERFDIGLMSVFDFGQSKASVNLAEAELIRAKYAYIFRVKILEYYFGLPIG